MLIFPLNRKKKANSAVPVKPSRQQNQKVDMESARKLDDDRKIKPEAKSTPKKQAKSGKNVEEKISSISNINKKVLKLNFEWPVRGKVIKNFAQSDNKGIDIAGEFGQSVRAAEAGKAVYCGDGLAGYGNLVIVKHDDSYLSAYAHNSRLNVKEGQPIKKGQVIARIGRPGSRQPLLHFQIRKNGKSINPLTLLPKH